MFRHRSSSPLYTVRWRRLKISRWCVWYGWWILGPLGRALPHLCKGGLQTDQSKDRVHIGGWNLPIPFVGNFCIHDSSGIAGGCRGLCRAPQGFIPADPHISWRIVQWGTGCRDKRGRRDGAVVEVDPGLAVQDTSSYLVSRLKF